MIFPVEHLPLAELRRLQSDRLIRLIQYLEAKSSFYQGKFQEVGISSKDINSIEDITKLPITYKQDVRDYSPYGMTLVPKNELRRIHCSSGSTGKPTVVTYNQADLEISSEVVARALHAAGGEPGMLLHNAHGYGVFTGGLGLHDGAGRLGMNVLPISDGNTSRQVDFITSLKPDFICSTPSYALSIIDEMAKRGIGPNDNSLRYAIFGAEPWTETIRNHIEKNLGVIATNLYGLSEIIGPGVSHEDWEEQGGAYVWEDHFYPEILDPETKEPLPYGEQGVLVLTTLTKSAMPLLRYWTNDITSLYYDPNGKRTMIKMKPIVGRADDMLIIGGVNVYPSQIEEAFLDVRGILPHYYLTPIKRKELYVQLQVDVEVANQHLVDQGVFNDKTKTAEFHERMAQQVQQVIKNKTRITTSVRIHPQDSLPKCTSGKINRVLTEAEMEKLGR